MRVLGLANFPREAAATRFRLAQFVEPLKAHRIELTISPFLSGEQFVGMYASGRRLGKAFGLMNSVRRRAGELLSAGNYDLLLVQREAMFFGPPIFEWLFRNVGRMPMVLDLDDATYVPYTSPSYGRLGSALKFFGKTDKLIERAEIVVCGNRFIAEYVESKGARAVVVPTVVDTEVFHPVEKTNSVPVIGWIGTHSTFPSVETLFPVLSKLAEKHQFVLKIIGSGRDEVSVQGVPVENLSWALEREVEDFQMLDIGLYPITVSSSANEQWLKGKSGFKAIQYMAVGVPFVMSPVGVCSEIGINGETHLNAESPEDWYNTLDKLLSAPGLRREMGKTGRAFSLAQFTVSKQADLLAGAFEDAIRTR